MTYSRIAVNPFLFLQLPRDRFVDATRRLYAQSETRLKNEDDERDLTWLGMLLCLFSGLLEISSMQWLLH